MKTIKLLFSSAIIILFILLLFFTGNMNISKAAGDLTIGSGKTTVLNGYQEYNNITIESGGTITHDLNTGAEVSNSSSSAVHGKDNQKNYKIGMYLKVDTLTIKSGGKIDVIGKGAKISSGASPGNGWVVFNNTSNNGNGRTDGQDGGSGGKPYPDTNIIEKEYVPHGTGGGRGGYETDGWGPAGGGGYFGSGGAGYGHRSAGGGAGVGGAGGSGSGGSKTDGANAGTTAKRDQLLTKNNDNSINYDSLAKLIKNSGYGGAGGNGIQAKLECPFGTCYKKRDGSINGGNGGGRVVIEAKKVVLENGATILAEGAKAQIGKTYYTTGGAGAAGSIGIIADEIVVNGTATLSTKGADAVPGTWSHSYSDDSSFGDGGAGGGGLVAIATKADLPSGLNINVNGGAKARSTAPDKNAGGAGMYVFAKGTPVATTYTLTVNKIGDGTGTVTKNPDSATYSAGTVVTLTAAADAGSTFTSWEGCTVDLSDPKKCSVTMDGNKTVTAKFDKTALSGMKIIDSPTPFDSFDYISPSKIDGTDYTVIDPVISPWEFALNDSQRNDLESGDNKIEIELTVKFNGKGCESGGNFTLSNSATFLKDGSSWATAAPANLIAECPKLKIIGDVGSTGGSITQDSKLTVQGPAVVIAKGTINDDVIGGQVIKLPEYKFNEEVKKPVNALMNKLWVEAQGWGDVTVDLNKNNKPGGGVWKKSENITLNQGYINTGTVMTDTNDIDLTAGFSGSSTGSMGIITKNGNVTIQNLSANQEIQNVAIYAPIGTVKFDNIGNPFTFKGMIVAKDIVVSNTVTKAGNIIWSPQVAKNPPPGFTDLLDTSDLVELPPQ